MSNQNTPILSLIIPIYNTEDYLAQCLDSIVNQTLKDMEIICINDGSTDSSLSIVETYAKGDSRITIINFEKNTCQGAARNAGLEIAKGKYIGFVDSDDWIELNTYKKVLEAMESNDVDLVCWGSKIIRDSSKISKKVVRATANFFSINYSGIKNIDDDFIKNIGVSPCTKLFKASLIKDNDIRFPDSIKHEDMVFHYLHCLRARNVLFLGDRFYNYRQRENSTMDLSYRQKQYKFLVDYVNAAFYFWKELNGKHLFVEHEKLFSELFAEWFETGFRLCRKEDQHSYLEYAGEKLKEMKINSFSIPSLKYLGKVDYAYLIENIKSGIPEREYNVYLFGTILLLRLKYYGNKIRIYLFGYLMILKIKTKDNGMVR